MHGKSISGYTLQRLLGTGGMAEVWYAENKIGKKAAVKLLLPKLCQDELVVSRFLTEAKVMVDLNHPNIRQVYDYGDIDGRPAIIMEYLDGMDLKAMLKRGRRFTDEELKKWWNQLVSALNYTHAQNIVHRDIKPSNIFLDNKGDVKLLDFGIAKVADTSSGTQTGSTLGTRIYMSPEQVKDPKRVGPKSDVYSLAVSFVHLLTGKAPYDSTTSSDYDIQVSIVTKPVDLSPLPEVWRSCLTPYLEKDPAKRPELKPFETISSIPTTPQFDEDEGTIVGETPMKPKQAVQRPVSQPRPQPSPAEPTVVNPTKSKKKAKWLVPAIIAAVAVIAVVYFLCKPKDVALYPASKGDKWGYIDKTGKFVIEPRFDNAYIFSEGYAAVEVDRQYGFINTKGEMVVAPQFSWVEQFSDGMAVASVDGERSGYIDKKGKMVIDAKFIPGGAGYFCEGLAAVIGGGGWGFIDKKGNFKIAPQFSSSGWFSEGLAAVETSWGKMGYVDHYGNIKIEPHFQYASGFADGVASVKMNDKWGAIDKLGNLVIQPQYDRDFDFSEGLAAVEIDGKMGYIDKSNNVVIQPKYDWAGHFCDGLAAAKVDGKWGYINKTGNWVIQPQFDEADNYKNGLAAVVFNYQIVYIDKNGNIVYLDSASKNPDDQAYLNCQTVNDYRNYISNFGHNAKHYSEAVSVIEQFVADSIQQAQKARAEEEARLRAEEAIKAEDAAYKKCTTVEACDKYLKTYPQGRYVEEVKKKRAKLVEESQNNNAATLPPFPSSYKGAPVAIFYFDYNSSSIKANTTLNRVAINALSDLLNTYAIKGFEVLAYDESSNGSSAKADAVVKQLKNMVKKANLNENSFSYKKTSYGFDWDRFYELIQNSSMSIHDKGQIVNLLKGSSNKDQELQNLMMFYPEIEREILPQLRRAEVYVY